MVVGKTLYVTRRSEWREWLSANHGTEKEIWLIGYRKDSNKPGLPYNDAVEEALCFGWIDSKPRTLDEERSMLWFAPRKPRTGWSRPNKERVERLIADGRMAAPGLAKIEAARRDGSWSALDAIERLEIPPDLGAALARHVPARPHFEAFPRSVKRGILEWIATARKPDTRARRIEETARLAARNVRANQWRG
jgi:uncharacterized protein YdeI (YjbR/CyaY-like superfamily)